MLTMPREVVQRTRQRQSDHYQQGRRAEYAKTLTRRNPSPDAKGGPGLFVTVSRKRLDYGRPLVQPGANNNGLSVWSAARIKTAGDFKATARYVVAPVTTTRTQDDREPRRPAGDDAALNVLLDAIAVEVHERTTAICDNIRAEFAGKIRATRKALPHDQARAAIVVLRQMRQSAIKAAREAANKELKWRQKNVPGIIFKPSTQFYLK